MTNHRQDDSRRQSAIQNLLNMFHFSNTTTLPLSSDDDVDEDVDEPPDKSLLPLSTKEQEMNPYIKSQCCSPMEHRVSLLTRELMTELSTPEASAPTSPFPAALSRASTFSMTSMPSTAGLTSDLGDTSPARSTSPSPPLPSTPHHDLHTSAETPVPSTKLSLPIGQGQNETAAMECTQPNTEGNLGRKRHITFACAGRPAEKEPPPIEEPRAEPAQPPKRKSVLTFACPGRPVQTNAQVRELPEVRREAAESCRNMPPSKTGQTLEKAPKVRETALLSVKPEIHAQDSPVVPSHVIPSASDSRPHFRLVSGSEREDAWVHEPIDSGHKLTLSDCMKKENVIRKIGEEAEEEAVEEEDYNNAQDGLEDEDGDNEDDFAPSDDGNESDNEAGFAESESDNDGGSDDEFWAPSNTTVATSVEQSTPSRRPTAETRAETALLSRTRPKLPRQDTTESIVIRRPKRRYLSKAQHLRPSTSDLPDSTDFVCGTLDEDRPLEAAYMSCLERKKRDKHILIPQDIDPSFPTTDPEDMDDEDDEDLDDDPEDHLWLKDQLDGFEDDPSRKRGSNQTHKPSTRHLSRLSPPKHRSHRSPPPRRHTVRRASPPPKGRLFGHLPKRLYSPPPPSTLKSPPATRRPSPVNISPTACQSGGLMISRLAQRPHTTRTSSLPQTPNPFFYHYRTRLQHGGRNTAIKREPYVRGPVDIVIGLEKKRQKRKEKFWRQNCRKAAKEHAERKNIIPGRGAERMRELGLECAERNRGYGLGQNRPVVLSL